MTETAKGHAELVERLREGDIGYARVRVDTSPDADGWCFFTPAAHPNDVERKLLEEFPDEYQSFGQVFPSTPIAAHGAGAVTEVDGWRCFHCDEVFTDRRAARDHFGFEQCSEPACRIKLGAERSLVTALRRAEKDAADAWAAIHNETTDIAKAYHAQASRHHEQLRIVEEEGYERGLRDGAALRPEEAAGQGEAIDLPAPSVEENLP